MGKTVLFHVRVREGNLEVVLRHMRGILPEVHAAASGRRELLLLARLRDSGDAGFLARALTELDVVESVSCCADQAAGAAPTAPAAP